MDCGERGCPQPASGRSGGAAYITYQSGSVHGGREGRGRALRASLPLAAGRAVGGARLQEGPRLAQVVGNHLSGTGLTSQISCAVGGAKKGRAAGEGRKSGLGAGFGVGSLAPFLCRGCSEHCTQGTREPPMPSSQACLRVLHGPRVSSPRALRACLGVLVDRAVAGEEAVAGGVEHAAPRPLLSVGVQRVGLALQRSAHSSSAKEHAVVGRGSRSRQGGRM